MIKKELREMYLNELSSGWEEERMIESAGGLQGAADTCYKLDQDMEAIRNKIRNGGQEADQQTES